MTDPTPLPPHPDDERLSALIDGEGRPDDDSHTESCAACTARLALLRVASVAVGAPVGPPDPARRTAAIDAALAAADADGDRGRVVPITRARGRAGPPRWLVAAAAVVLVALAVPLLARVVGERDADDVATSTALSADDAASGTTAAAGAAPSAELAGSRDAGDLGEIDAQTDLPAQLGLGSRPADDAAGGGATTTAPARGTEGAATTAQNSDTACEAALRADDPQLGALVVSAAATFEGEPVAVLGFDAGGRARVYAVAVDTCEVRTVQTAR